MLSLSKLLRTKEVSSLIHRPGKHLPAFHLFNRCSSQDTTAGVPYKTLQSEDTRPPDALPKEADVIVIGGGSLGSSTLYHLTKLGLKNVVLLEKNQLTAGTTWHSAGLVWRLRPSDVDVELLAHTRTLAADVLENETGLSTGWIQNGGLFIADNKERLNEYQRLMTLGKVFGVDSHVLSPKETKKVYPLMNVDDLYGTLYSPGDGTIDPAGWATTLTRAAKNSGAQVFENCPVTSITTTVDDLGVKHVTGVDTPTGHIKTKAVVNCAGVWAPCLGEMVDAAVPLVAMYHSYIVTERIEGIENMPNVRDHDLSVYLKLQGDGLSVGGYEHNPIFWDKVSKDFAFGLFDLDWDVFSAHVDGAVHRVPEIGETGVKSTVCGPESFTADHKPLIGEVPECRGFYLGCGFNSAGIMLSGGCGRELAQWIVHGHPTLDMYGYDIRRFHSSLTSNQKWNRERSHESYAKNYSIVYEHDEPLASRNMRCDPFHQVLLEAGCVYQERLGWERPGWFVVDSKAEVNKYDYYGAYNYERKVSKYEELLTKDYTFDFPRHHDIIGKECEACRTKVAAFNMSYFGKFYITGPDAQKAVDWIFSNNMQKSAGSTTYTCMLNKDGGVQADVTVSVLEDETSHGALSPSSDGRSFYVAVGGGIAEYAWCHIKKILQDNRFNCQLIDMSEEMGMLSIQGPKSRDLLKPLLNVDLSHESFAFSTHKKAQLAGHDLRILRLTFVGELGYELHIPAESCIPVYNAVMEEGKKYGTVNSGYRAIDSLSIEKGFKHWHQDIRHDDTPLEGGLAFTCKLKTDTPFLGREALERQKTEGLKKKLICLTLDEHKALHGLEGIYRDGQSVGYLRRADFGFAVNKTICYGYVKHPDNDVIKNEWLKNGTYSIDAMGEMFPATLHLKPVFDPKNLRVKGIYE